MSDAMSDSLFICAHVSHLVMRKYMHASAVLYFAVTRLKVHFVHRSRESHIARWEKSFPLSLIASQSDIVHRALTRKLLFCSDFSEFKEFHGHGFLEEQELSREVI